MAMAMASTPPASVQLSYGMVRDDTTSSTARCRHRWVPTIRRGWRTLTIPTPSRSPSISMRLYKPLPTGRAWSIPGPASRRVAGRPCKSDTQVAGERSAGRRVPHVTQTNVIGLDSGPTVAKVVATLQGTVRSSCWLLGIPVSRSWWSRLVRGCAAVRAPLVPLERYDPDAAWQWRPVTVDAGSGAAEIRVQALSSPSGLCR